MQLYQRVYLSRDWNCISVFTVPSNPNLNLNFECYFMACIEWRITIKLKDGDD